MGEPTYGDIPGLENPEGRRQVARRFRVLRLVGMTEVLATILAFFLLVGTGLSLGTLLALVSAVALGLISFLYLNHSRSIKPPRRGA